MNEYRALPLRAHAFLSDAPLHDVWRVEADHPLTLDAAVDGLRQGMERLMRNNWVVRGLFGLRGLLGQVFGWDRESSDTGAVLSEGAARLGVGARPAELSPRSYIRRLTEAERAESRVPPGTPAALGVMVYQTERELVSELINATVQGLVVIAVEGRTAYLAIYVKPVGWITGAYMALIDPFRRVLIYPAMLRAWREALTTRNQ